jgi:hypothetical protein
LKPIVAAFFILAVAGCAVRGPTTPSEVAPSTTVETPAQADERRASASRPTYNLTGYPPAVREGYIDGCESAKGTQYARKDASRMSNDAQYSMGWNDGFGICKKK